MHSKKTYAKSAIKVIQMLNATMKSSVELSYGNNQVSYDLHNSPALLKAIHRPQEETRLLLAVGSQAGDGINPVVQDGIRKRWLGALPSQQRPSAAGCKGAARARRAEEQQQVPAGASGAENPW